MIETKLKRIQWRQNMIRKKVDALLPKETEEQAIELIRSAEALFPFLQLLTSEERKKLNKLGTRSLDFVERSLIHAKENKNLFPSFFAIEEFDRDCILMAQLRRIMIITEAFYNKLKDTDTLTGV